MQAANIFFIMANSPSLPPAYKKKFDLLPTLILRHRKENLKKCSLRGLEERDDFHFVRYPCKTWPDLTGYCLLTIDAPLLSSEDREFGLFLIDGTWKYAQTMEKSIPKDTPLIKRSLPGHFRTAYPRYQTACSEPERGLASIEALYIAFLLTRRNYEGLLDHYHWKNEFLKMNRLT
jgi:pre-rRNA-processing protein TSR3